MYVTQDLVYHVARQVIGEGDTVEPSPDPITPSGQCESGNEYDGRLGLRVSAIFVILIGSSLGKLGRQHQSIWLGPIVHRRVVSRLRQPS